MSTIILNSNSVSDTTMIPNLFIDHFMPSANGSYVKVYLYLLRCINCTTDAQITISSIADRLDDTEKDITRALCYWEKVNLISLVRNTDNDIISITINDIYALKRAGEYTADEAALSISGVSSGLGAAATVSGASSGLGTAATVSGASSGLAVVSGASGDLGAAVVPNDSSSLGASTNGSNGSQTSTDFPVYAGGSIEQQEGKETPGERNFEKPTYSEAQIKQLTNTDEVKWLLNIIEIYLDRLIKPMDLQLILYLYESVGFSAELIMYLYEYCVSKNKKNPSYIEAVAMSWAEEGVDTVEKAEAATALYNSNYNAVNKAFGLNRAPGQVEKQFINKWLNKFGFTIEIIVEACNRTILQTQKPDFKYADKILENWHKKGVKEFGQISKLDEEHSRIAAMKANNKTAAPQKPAANNRFNAFPQRTYTDEDYSSMEQRLLHKQ